MGRGLGSLLADQKSQTVSDNTAGKTEIAAGVRTLMTGHNAPKTNPVPSVASPKGPAIPLWYFLAADALLIGLALLIAFTSPKPMPTSRMILSIVVVVCAAGCGFCALLAGADKG